MDEALKKYDQILVDHQIKKLQIYSERGIYLNGIIHKFNRRKRFDYIFEQHVIDCLSVIPFFEKRDLSSMLVPDVACLV